MVQYAVIDTGNIGAYITAVLADSGACVSAFLGEVAPRGLRIQSCYGDFSTTRFDAVSQVGDLPISDVVFLNVNTWVHFGLSKKVISHVLKSGAILILFQKGVNDYRVFSEWFPQVHILGGLCWLKPTRVSCGRIKHDFGHLIQIGDYLSSNAHPPNYVKQMLTAVDFSERLGFEWIFHFWPCLWTRYVFNLPLFLLSVLENETSKALLENPGSLGIVNQLRREIIAVALAENISVDNAFISIMDQSILKGPASYPGLKQDYDAGRPLDLDDLLGGFFAKAQALQVSVSRVREVYDRLLQLVL